MADLTLCCNKAILTGLEESGNPVFALNIGTVPATIARRRAAMGLEGTPTPFLDDISYRNINKTEIERGFFY